MATSRAARRGAGGAAAYRDALDLLASRGLPARWRPTCRYSGLLAAPLDGGLWLVVEGGEDDLPARREERQGWAASLYDNPDRRGWPYAHACTDESVLDALDELVDRVLRAGRGALASGGASRPRCRGCDRC